MRVNILASLLCLAFFLWSGCSKEEETLPQRHITKVRKPIIRPLSEKDRMSSLPLPEKPGPRMKKGGPEKKKVKESGGRLAVLEKMGGKRQKEPPQSHETQPAGVGVFKEVKKIRFETTPEGEEKVLIWLNGKFPPRTFPLEGDRPRVVCDFFDAGLGGSIGSSIKAGGRIIKEIRIGSYKGSRPKVRVVLDLVRRESSDYEVQQIFYEDENIFALVLK
ncbi:MAG: AMIN domain-containing protein [Deltaproteobacteria bacterium]|nr:AMIN domain-containing protein [Deltaproteobacteria bacterium]